MTAGTYSSGATTTTAATTTVLTVLPLDMQVAWWSPAAPWIGTLSGPHYCRAYTMRDQRPGDRERRCGWCDGEATVPEVSYVS